MELERKHRIVVKMWSKAFGMDHNKLENCLKDGNTSLLINLTCLLRNLMQVKK